MKPQGPQLLEQFIRDGLVLYEREYGARLRAGEQARANPSAGEIPDFARFVVDKLNESASSPASGVKVAEMLGQALKWWVPTAMKSGFSAQVGPIINVLENGYRAYGAVRNAMGKPSKK